MCSFTFHFVNFAGMFLHLSILFLAELKLDVLLLSQQSLFRAEYYKNSVIRDSAALVPIQLFLIMEYYIVSQQKNPIILSI